MVEEDEDYFANSNVASQRLSIPSCARLERHRCRIRSTLSPFSSFYSNTLPNIGIILNLIFGRSHAAHRAATSSRYYHFIAWAGTKPYHDIGTATVATPLWRCAKTSRLNPLHICQIRAYLFKRELVPARLILKTFNNNWSLGALIFVERACPFRGIVMFASKAFGERNVSNHCLSNNLPFLRINRSRYYA